MSPRPSLLAPPALVALVVLIALGITAHAGGDSHVSVLTGDQVIEILDETVDWYRTLGIQQQNATQPSDLLILYANRQTADQVVGLAFEIARANAELLSSDASAGASAADAASPQALDQQQALLGARRLSLQREMAAERQSSAKSTELQGELAMLDARKNLLDTMSAFVSQSDPKAGGANALKAQIDAIAATVPASSPLPATSPMSPVATSPTSPAATPTPPVSTAAAVAPARYGLWDLTSTVLRLRGKIGVIDSIEEHTARLAATFQRIGAPPLAQLKAYSARSDALAAQADTAGAPVLKTLRDDFDTLAWLFKQTSAILVPLSKEQVLLQQYRHNLGSWRDATRRQYREAWTSLGVRLCVLAGVLAVIFALSEVWRRAVLRYSHEPRRRYQLLLVRKVVVWAVVIGVVGLNVVTEISTFATFAGLLTAGVAVAMQSVLVSVVGYFFLIGKYGIRIGDRVQIGTVVGEVIDLGLVRMHLMELSSTGPLGPTGRVVAFANLIVFQASGGLFKQIPGVDLAWHETVLALPAVTDYAALKAKLVAALDHVVDAYRGETLRQTQRIALTTASESVTDTAAQVQMHLVDGKMEAKIRYPIHGEQAARIDEEVAEAVLAVLAATQPPR